MHCIKTLFFQELDISLFFSMHEIYNQQYCITYQLDPEKPTYYQVWDPVELLFDILLSFFIYIEQDMLSWYFTKNHILKFFWISFHRTFLNHLNKVIMSYFWSSKIILRSLWQLYMVLSSGKLQSLWQQYMVLSSGILQMFAPSIKLKRSLINKLDNDGSKISLFSTRLFITIW